VERSIVFCLYLARIKKSVTVQNTRKQFLTTPNILFIYCFWPILERLLINSSGGLHELLVYPLTLPKILEMFCAFLHPNHNDAFWYERKSILVKMKRISLELYWNFTGSFSYQKLRKYYYHLRWSWMKKKSFHFGKICSCHFVSCLACNNNILVALSCSLISCATYPK
jgi:hypothetical protein